MKTTLKQLTAGAFIAILLLAGNAITYGSEVKTSEAQITESTLQLESWMTDETIWNANSDFTENFVQETETALELESWMTSEYLWKVEKTMVEKELALESWMVDSEFWK